MLLLHLYAVSFAQLNKVAPLTSLVHDAAKIADVNLLVNTKDFTNVFLFPLQDAYFTTIQLVHASHPFPPIWYQIGTKLLSNAGHTASDFYLGPHINEKTGRLSYSFVIIPDTIGGHVSEGYVIIDTLTMEPVDTLTEGDFILPDSSFEAVDNHEYEEDEHGNKIFFTGVKTRIDARCLSGIAGDSLMPAEVQYIVVLDSLNHVKFIWNPLQHLSPCEMHWEWRNSSTTYAGSLNWSHANSVRWANDGNILYSFRHIGIGKINSATGDIMFKLGGKDTLNSIHLPDSIGYSLQHDFSQRPDGKYSLFSNGDDSIRPYMAGMIYDIDEINKTVQLVDRYIPQPQCISKALGGLDTYHGMYFLNRGMKFCFSTNQIVDIINQNDKSPVAEIFAPAVNFSYRAYPTTWNISRRPSVTLQSDTLATDSISGLYEYTWYRVTNTFGVNVGTGLSYSPTVSGKYVVEAKAGSGSFVSYLLSDPVDYFITGVSNTKKKTVSVTYNTTDKIARISMNETSGVLSIYNISGQKVNEISLHNNINEVYFKNAPGIYIFEITTPNSHNTCKVYVD
ncbi:MAG: hypothetical protein JWN78_1920 [Bacteroidota bacterium]|nr:hypothetical protein [Bacteroidota bacterium]